MSGRPVTDLGRKPRELLIPIVTCTECGVRFDGPEHRRFCSRRCRDVWHRRWRGTDGARGYGITVRELVFLAAGTLAGSTAWAIAMFAF